METQGIGEAQYVIDQRKAAKVLRFSGHWFEMVVVMMLGMCILGCLFSALHLLLFGSGYAAAWRDHVALAAFGMAFNMTVPMVLWMRFRGHSWQRGAEMAVTMNLPLLPLLMLYGVGAIPAGSVLGLQMLLMLPAMVGAMLYRKEEYTAPHHKAGHRRRRLRRFAEAR
jgi:flagellar biosynthetic protein FliP